MLVRKSWATPRYAADKGLLLRDTEHEIAAVRRICLLLERARTRSFCVLARGSSEDLVKPRRQEAATMKGLATGES
jgi:hypothetical protein